MEGGNTILLKKITNNEVRKVYATIFGERTTHTHTHTHTQYIKILAVDMSSIYGKITGDYFLYVYSYFYFFYYGYELCIFSNLL